ncbi:DUF1707 SHOCT-like domain-containing protein [Phytoactinopolyspora halotolerans]|uniref:DUF1707 domain-containing protein n=1 Tax=Phytoactinopolyspora halotolerans TaxID=1981512 RepID=A0A6L9S4A3_9ACTN|nr:DUF1707 domain-containing protein [Phytoactinopolyspora halotolerans]NEE00305.1 DUF1707 domain-containing protein [Phytoactinopolyspora halotolerans]
MASSGRSHGPDRRWRPSDADRERYLEAISTAFSDGRITADDLQSRTALVYEARTIADLEALVEDVPSEPPPVPPTVAERPSYARMIYVGVAIAAGIAALIAVTAAQPEERDISTSTSVEEAPLVPGLDPAEVEVPDVATEKLDLLTEAGLVEMWDTMSGADVADIAKIGIYGDYAHIEVRAETDEPGVDEIRYQGGFASPREWERAYSEETEAGFFGWNDVSPQAVAAAIDATPGALERPDAEVAHVSVGRRGWERGQIVIQVVADDGGNTFSVRWDAAGSTVLSTH